MWDRSAYALAGSGATAFAHFATKEPGVACRAVAREMWDRSAYALAGSGATAFAHFATKEPGVACRAVAREASEGWWSQAGSNRRPHHCERCALPAELWPLRGCLSKEAADSGRHLSPRR